MKKITLFITAILITIIFSACGNEGPIRDEEVSSDPKTQTTITVPIEITESVSESTHDTASVITTEVTTETIETTQETIPIETKPVLQEKDTITIEDKCEFFLDAYQITKDVIPPAPGSYYTHYEADEGKAYVDIIIAYKNLETTSINAEKVAVGSLVYSGQYVYEGFSIIEKDSRSSFTYSNITDIAPLTAEYIHLLFAVPEVIMGSENAIEATLNIAGEAYSIMVREGPVGQISVEDISETAVERTSGQVSEKEMVNTNNSLFFVDFVNITNDVLPPAPSSFYTHYEAEAGKIFVDICFAYTSLHNAGINADKVISAKLIYAGKYEYTGFSTIEKESRGSFTYSNITNIAPLCTEYIHYLFSVPQEIESSDDSIEIQFGLDGNEYSFVVR